MPLPSPRKHVHTCFCRCGSATPSSWNAVPLLLEVVPCVVSRGHCANLWASILCLNSCYVVSPCFEQDVLPLAFARYEATGETASAGCRLEGLGVAS